MRLRNVKNKQELLDSPYLVRDPYTYKGKWRDYFHNSNPIHIEIGMGKGQFIIQMALLNPDINYIGIEKYDSVIVRALEKIPDNIENLVMIRMNALEIDSVFDHEVDHIYLNFSDPWPKKRHHFRRLTSTIFLEKYDKIFSSEASIEMRTDNQDLYIYSLESLSQYGYSFSNISFHLHRDCMPLVTTEYEDKFSKEDIPIYYFMSSKKKK